MAKPKQRTAYELSHVLDQQLSKALDGEITPAMGNTVCNFAAKITLIWDRQMKYARLTGQQPVIDELQPKRSLTVVEPERKAS